MLLTAFYLLFVGGFIGIVVLGHIFVFAALLVGRDQVGSASVNRAADQAPVLS